MMRRSWLGKVAAAALAMLLPWKRTVVVAEALPFDEVLWTYPKPLTEHALLFYLFTLQRETGRYPIQMRGNAKALLAYLMGGAMPGDRRYPKSAIGYDMDSTITYMAPGLSVSIVQDEEVPDGVFVVKLAESMNVAEVL